MWDFVVLFPAIERDYINLINDSPNSGKSEKMPTRITPNTDPFQAVEALNNEELASVTSLLAYVEIFWRIYQNLHICICTGPHVSNGIDRTSRPKVFCKKYILRYLEKFTGNHLCQRFFFLIKFQAEICNFLKKETLAQVFSC